MSSLRPDRIFIPDQAAGNSIRRQLLAARIDDLSRQVVELQEQAKDKLAELVALDRQKAVITTVLVAALDRLDGRLEIPREEFQGLRGRALRIETGDASLVASLVPEEVPPEGTEPEPGTPS